MREALRYPDPTESVNRPGLWLARITTQLALAYPEIGVMLTSAGRKVLECPPAHSLRDRLYQLYGERDDLLEPPEQRPAVFYRGYDLFDQEKVGFVSTVAVDGEQIFSQYDTSVPGNSHDGHLYGTALPADDKRAIVEYLKTF